MNRPSERQGTYSHPPTSPSKEPPMTNNTPATTGAPQPAAYDHATDQGVYRQGEASRFSPWDRQRLRALQPALSEASDADLDNLFAYCDKTALDPYTLSLIHI